MPENRGRAHHRERMAEALRDEIGSIIEGELGDPRIGLATVYEVLLAPDGKSARVFVSVTGDEDEAKDTLAGLNAAKNYIRYEVGERMALRHAPELYFQVGRAEDATQRVDELLQRLKKRQKNKDTQQDAT